MAMHGLVVRRRGRLLRAIGAAALLTAVTRGGPTLGSAQGLSPRPVPNPRQFRPRVQPLGYGDRQVTVIAEVRGEPVAAVQAARPGSRLTLREERSIADQLTRTQAPVQSR